MQDHLAKIELSVKISKDLIKHGMNFVGPSIIHGLVQAVRMVNNHEVSCFRYVKDSYSQRQ